MDTPGEGQVPKTVKVKNPAKQARTLANTVAKRRQYFIDRGTGIKWPAMRANIHKSNNAFVEAFALLDALHAHVLCDPGVRFKKWRRIFGNKQKYEIVGYNVKPFVQNLKVHMRRSGMGQEIDVARSKRQAHKQSLTRSRKPAGQGRQTTNDDRSRETTNSTPEEEVLSEVDAHAQVNQATRTQESRHSFVTGHHLESLLASLRMLYTTIAADPGQPAENSATSASPRTAANCEDQIRYKVEISCRRM